MWLIFTIITIFLWGGADVFYKIGSNEKDKYSHLKITIFVGLAMGIHAVLFLLFTGTRYELINIIRYLPVSLLYILSMIIGYVGLRYIKLSIVSPIGNSSGAVAFILCYIFLDEKMTLLQISAVTIILFGIFFLAVIHKKTDKVAVVNEEDNKRYRSSALAILFPIFYCFIDGIGTFTDALILNRVMNEDQALISYEMTFFVVAVVMLIFLLVIKRQRINVFQQKEPLAAAILETSGQFFYIRAMAANAVLAVPIVACYSIASILLSRIFLKEKLIYKQYLIIAAVVIAVGILGIE